MPTDLAPVDEALAAVLRDERERQRETLSLIASENHADESVLAAQGSVFTNKYAEGTPGARYYAGCEHADELEELAVERATELFGAEHVNVQPHSGTQANIAAYLALIDEGDVILSLDLTSGGHLSHGFDRSLVGKHYDVSHYGVDPETGRLDYDAIEAQARDVDPDVVVSGYSAYPREVDWEGMQAVAESVGAYHVADIAHVTGLVAAGVHDSPVGVADVVTCSTHKSIRSGRGGLIMCDDEYADAIDRAVMPGCQGGPLMHNVAGKAAGFHEALQPEFAAYAERVVENADVVADRLRSRGFELVSGGTDVHFVVVDLRESHPELTGAAAEAALADVGLVANKQTVPGEPRKPTVASGVRIGTPAITTRGFDETATRRLADCVASVLDARGDEHVRREVAGTVDELCASHPLYPDGASSAER